MEKGLEGGCKVGVIGVVGKGGSEGRVGGSGGKGKRVGKWEEEGIVGGCGVGEGGRGGGIISIGCGGSRYSLGLVRKGYGEGMGSSDRLEVGLYKECNSLYYRMYWGNGEVVEEGGVVSYKSGDDKNNSWVDQVGVSGFAKK